MRVSIFIWIGAQRIRGDGAMFTVIEIHSGEAFTEGGDPLLFDTFDEAAAWTIERFGLDAGKNYRIEEV